MQTLEIVYLTAAVGSVLAMAPQIRQLWITKQSDELNLVTWIMWSITQCVALVYSLAIGAIPYFVVNVAWIIFYIVMITLIIKYRVHKRARLAYELIDVEALDDRMVVIPR